MAIKPLPNMPKQLLDKQNKWLLKKLKQNEFREQIFEEYN